MKLQACATGNGSWPLAKVVAFDILHRDYDALAGSDRRIRGDNVRINLRHGADRRLVRRQSSIIPEPDRAEAHPLPEWNSTSAKPSRQAATDRCPLSVRLQCRIDRCVNLRDNPLGGDFASPGSGFVEIEGNRDTNAIGLE